MSRERLDMTTLAAGIAAVVVGTLLALDSGGSITLTAGWISAIVCAAAGAALVIGAITERDG